MPGLDPGIHDFLAALIAGRVSFVGRVGRRRNPPFLYANGGLRCAHPPYGLRAAMNASSNNSDKLPDQLDTNLRVVFVGTAAGHRSADIGAYYAHSGNRFWSTLHEVGLTARRYQPHEFRELLKLGIGFTDLCKASSGNDQQISVEQFDLERFEATIRRYRPKSIAFTSKKASSLFLGRPTRDIALGQQEAKPDFPTIFVLSSPSGAASSHWNITPWRELAAWVENLLPQQQNGLSKQPG